MSTCQHHVFLHYIFPSCTLVLFISCLLKRCLRFIKSIYIYCPFPNHPLDHPLDGEWVMTLYLYLYIYRAILDIFTITLNCLMTCRIGESILKTHSDHWHWSTTSVPSAMHSQVGNTYRPWSHISHNRSLIWVNTCVHSTTNLEGLQITPKLGSMPPPTTYTSSRLG